MTNGLFAIRLKLLRENAGYKSQQSFADKFGVAQSTVGNWEAGKREPNFELTIKLAKFFNVSVDYLLGNNNPDPQTALNSVSNNIKIPPVPDENSETNGTVSRSEIQQHLYELGYIGEDYTLSDADLNVIFSISTILDSWFRFKQREE